ncbi:MAG: hypothetical protein ACYTGG_13920 [Planctomycetota bacterium]|jgi:hypothetical protein
MPVRILLVAALAGAAVILSGCENGQTVEPSPPPRPARTDATWPYWPREVRIHPLSRLVYDEDGRLVMIEARVEFLDVEGHTTKGNGQLQIDLHDAEGERGRGVILTWDLDLSDAEINRKRYDVVTRTYLCLLELAPEDLPAAPELRVYFASTTGQMLEPTTALLRTREP